MNKHNKYQNKPPPYKPQRNKKQDAKQKVYKSNSKQKYFQKVNKRLIINPVIYPLDKIDLSFDFDKYMNYLDKHTLASSIILDSEMTKAVHNFYKFPNLTSVTMTFISEKNIVAFVKSLKLCKNIEHLTIIIKCKYIDNSWNILFDELYNNEKIISLEIQLQKYFLQYVMTFSNDYPHYYFFGENFHEKLIYVSHDLDGDLKNISFGVSNINDKNTKLFDVDYINYIKNNIGKIFRRDALFVYILQYFYRDVNIINKQIAEWLTKKYTVNVRISEQFEKQKTCEFKSRIKNLIRNNNKIEKLVVGIDVGIDCYPFSEINIINIVDDLICNNALQTIQFHPPISCYLDDKNKLIRLMDCCHKNLEIDGLIIKLEHNGFPNFENQYVKCMGDLMKRSHHYHVYKMIMYCLNISYTKLTKEEKIWYINLVKQHSSLLDFCSYKKLKL